jgi:hypothetical protein
MYCPKCGLERQSSETSFCSRCGFLLTGTADLIELGGLLPDFRNGADADLPSPRGRGVKQGLFILLLSFLIVPLFALLTVVLNMRSPVLPVLALLLLGVGGILRMIYAWMFESPGSARKVPGRGSRTPSEFAATPEPKPLPDLRSVPASSYVPPAAGIWRETNEFGPRSVTEGTTKLLENEDPS